MRINNPTPRNRYDAGHTMFIPPNLDVWGYADDSTSAVRDIRMCLDYRVIESLLAEEFEPKKWTEPLFLLYDDRITQCAELLAKECDADEESPLYGESLMTALLAALFTSPQTRVKAVRSGLARWQVRRVVEYMEANLLEDIRLTELAGVAGLSPSQFARAFKASVGLTPHRWLVEQRIAPCEMVNGEGRKVDFTSCSYGWFCQSEPFHESLSSCDGNNSRALVAKCSLRRRLVPVDLGKSQPFQETREDSGQQLYAQIRLNR